MRDNTKTKGHLLHDDSSHQHNHYHENGEISCHEGAVMDLKLLNHETNLWNPVADMKVVRLYYSNALLLPHEPILTAAIILQITENKSKIDILKPLYLFRGNRPIIKRCKIKITIIKK